jgi:hypothetical protein
MSCAKRSLRAKNREMTKRADVRMYRATSRMLMAV